MKTYRNERTCARLLKVKKANSKWIAKQLVRELRAYPSMKTPEAFDWLKRNRGVIIDEHLVYAGLVRARKIVEGSEKAQYNALWDYTNELDKRNPGSSVKLGLKVVDPTAPHCFDKLYICLEACMRGFKNGCRPLIGLDGCFLKGYYGGELLTAVAQDGNNSPFVIAYAFVDVENTANWKWFLERLHEDLGDYKENGWNFISDQQKVCVFLLCRTVIGISSIHGLMIVFSFRA